MPQLAPLFARMMLGKSRDTKIVTTLDAGLQRQLEELAMNWKSPAGTQLAGDDRRRSYRYESARLGGIGGYQR
jgi:hypothetical protein